MQKLSYSLVLYLTIIQLVLSAPSEDEITDLPGLPSPPNFKQYSGYLNATGDKLFHYWFVESQNDPKNDPLALWLNGGPGCSSVMGLLSENGPFAVNDDGETLRYNNYSWNKIANMLYLESPAGVGYSYSLNGVIATNDSQVANDNYAALLSFFDKFPEYKANDFYITGESYGGVYIPSLGVNIINGNEPINFKAFAIGNGLHNYDFNHASLVVWSGYHGIFSNELTNNILSACCQSTDPITCDFLVSSENLNCSKAVVESSITDAFSGLNVYNIYSDCDTPFRGQLLKNEYHPWQSILKKLGLPLSNVALPCEYSPKEPHYMNQPDVRKALHIPDEVRSWTQCSDIVSYQYTEEYEDMTPQYKLLLPKVRALLYHGDLDSKCNFLGGEWFADSLGQQVIREYQPWHYKSQTAGFVKDYVKLSFVTVLGSGHLVPSDKPAQALELFNAFLNDYKLL